MSVPSETKQTNKNKQQKCPALQSTNTNSRWCVDTAIMLLSQGFKEKDTSHLTVSADTT